MNTMGSRIAHARRAVGLSQRKVAEALDTGQVCVSRWETGKGCPRLERLTQLARLLKVSPAWLLFGGYDDNVGADSAEGEA